MKDFDTIMDWYEQDMNEKFTSKVSFDDFVKGYWLTTEEINKKKMLKNRKEKLNKLGRLNN